MVCSLRIVANDPGRNHGSLLQTCDGCGFDFDHDVARCPDCGARTALGRRRTYLLLIAVAIAIVVLAAIATVNITAISPNV